MDAAKSMKLLREIERSGAKLICTYCGVELTQATAQIDHVVPRSQGGLDVNENLVGCCMLCNATPEARPVGVVLDPGLLAAPLDLDAGRRLALRWYPWAQKRLVDDERERSRARRAKDRDRREQAVAAGLGGDAFPFGAAP